jgi:hypothetical protein
LRGASEAELKRCVGIETEGCAAKRNVLYAGKSP